MPEEITIQQLYDTFIDLKGSFSDYLNENNEDLINLNLCIKECNNFIQEYPDDKNYLLEIKTGILNQKSQLEKNIKELNTQIKSVDKYIKIFKKALELSEGDVF